MLKINLMYKKIEKQMISLFQVEFVDMNYGSDQDPMKNPFLFAEHLEEIKNSQSVSRGCFFLVRAIYIILYPLRKPTVGCRPVMKCQHKVVKTLLNYYTIIILKKPNHSTKSIDRDVFYFHYTCIILFLTYNPTSFTAKLYYPTINHNYYVIYKQVCCPPQTNTIQFYVYRSAVYLRKTTFSTY